MSLFLNPDTPFADDPLNTVHEIASMEMGFTPLSQTTKMLPETNKNLTNTILVFFATVEK